MNRIEIKDLISLAVQRKFSIKIVKILHSKMLPHILDKIGCLLPVRELFGVR